MTSGAGRRRRRVLSAAAAVVVLVGTVAAAFAPRLINLKSVRSRLESAASSALGGKVTFGHIDLVYLPRPGFAIRQVNVSAPAKARGTVGSVSVVPALLPLLRGTLRVSAVRVDRPDLVVELPEANREKGAVRRTGPLQWLAPLLETIVSRAPDEVVEVNGGRVAVSRGGRILVTLRDLNVNVAFPAKELRFSLRCASDLWETASAKGALDPSGGERTGELSVLRLNLAGLGALLASEGGSGFSGGAANLDVRFSTKGFRSLHAEVRLEAPRLSLRRPGRRDLDVEGVHVEGAFDADGVRRAATLSRLSLESPRLLLEGAFRVDDSVPEAELTARGSGLDVTRLREKLLRFAGDVPTVLAILGIFRGGTLTSFSFDAKGKTAAELGVFEGMSIHGSLADGRVLIGSIGLGLEDASGDVSVERGVLTAENAAARIGNSRAWDGNVRVGLAEGDDTLYVDSKVRSDLAGLPAILERAVRGGCLREELPLVESLSGRATGRLTFENRRGGLKTTISLSGMELSARHRRIPLPISIERGTFFYDGDRLGVGRLSGSLGRSTFSGLTARLRLGADTSFETLSGDLDVSLDELFPWLASESGMQALRKQIRDVRGAAALSISRLSGPISRPGEWQYEATGRLKNVFLEAPFLPKPLAGVTGEFGMDGQAIRVAGLEARTMDASLRISGALDGYRGGRWTLEATTDGDLGPEAIGWTWEKAALPADFRPAAPISVADLHVGVAAKGDFSLAGNFNFRRGPRVTLDLASDEAGLDVRRLAIKDDWSGASFGFRKREGALDLRFTGHLEAASVERLFERRRERYGRIEGDFRMRVPLDRTGRPTAEGTLQAKDLKLATPAGELTVERLDARAAETGLSVADSALALDGQRFSVTGGATFEDEGIVLDVNVATGGISWETVERAFDRLKDKERASAAAGDPLSARRVLGDVHLSVGSFGYRDLEWKPVLADVRLGKESTTATIRKAEVCGISTTGDVTVRNDGTLAADIRVAASGPDIGVPLTCLGIERASLSGRYEASLRAGGTGKPSELLCSLRGPLWLRASRGSVGKSNLLTKLLGTLNATSVFSGRAPALLATSLPYDRISVDGELDGDSVSIREVSLETPAFSMAGSGRIGYRDGSVDLMVLACPLSTVDKVIQFIPLVRYVLGGDFLSVAANVTGTLDDPYVRISPARDVGRELINVLTRTVRLPVQVFDPKSP
jgi:hypothetical protein